MAVSDQRWGSRQYRADQALGARTRSAMRAFYPEGDNGHGGEGLMGQSRGNATVHRASGGAGTSSRAWSPSMQPLAPGVLLRTPGPLRPPGDAQGWTPEVVRALRLAKDRTFMAFGDAKHEQASTLA